jgi:hypothetical protein
MGAALEKFKTQSQAVSLTDCIVMAVADHYGTKDIFGKAYAVASGAISILSVAGSRRGPNGQFVTICGRCRSQRDKPFFGFDKFKDAGYRRLEPSTEWKEAA